MFVPFFPYGATVAPPLNAIARRRGMTAQQITLGWLLRRSPAMLPIPATLSLAHLNQNVATSKIELTDAEFEELRWSTTPR